MTSEENVLGTATPARKMICARSVAMNMNAYLEKVGGFASLRTHHG